jgi:hypothetical protein
MRRIGSTSSWRVRATQLALALGGTGLMTAIAAAAVGVGVGRGGDDGGMAAAVLAQRIAEGRPVRAKAQLALNGEAPPETEAQTRAAILAAAAKLEVDMTATIEHTEKLRVAAQKARDLIRVRVVTSKLNDMKGIMAIAQPAFASLRQPGQELFVMRAKLMIIRQGWDRMREALAEAEAAEGDSVATVAMGLGPLNGESPDDEAEADPTLPANPRLDPAVLERPAEASTFK